MACVNPDGKPTESGAKMLRALQARSKSPEEVAQETGLSLFRVRSGLRELSQADLVVEKAGKYEITDKGTALV
jgi:predicted transcriptional regulator